MTSQHSKSRREFDIDDFVIDQAQSNRKIRKSPPAVALSNTNRTTTTDNAATSRHAHAPNVQRALDALIYGDINDITRVSEAKVAQQETHSTDRSAETTSTPSSTTLGNNRSHRASLQSVPSKHVVDLRKSYLIEKHAKHTIRTPKVRFIDHCSTLLWNIVARTLPRKKIQYYWPRQSDERASNAVSNDYLVLSLAAHLRASALFVVILIVLLLPIGILGQVQSINDARQSVAHLGRSALANLFDGLTELSQDNYPDAINKLSEARQNFQGIQTSLESFNALAYELAMKTPKLKNHLSLIQHLTQIGEHTSIIGQHLAASLSARNFDDSADVLEQLAHSFSSIHTALGEILDDIYAIEIDRMPSEIAPRVRALQEMSPVLHASTGQAASILRLTRELIGGERLKRHLIILQNSRELRPTGGFIGSYALANFSRGRLTHLEFPEEGSYVLQGSMKQNIIPPEPISILNDRWQLWDANWWPDFPTSAKKIAWFYDQAGGPTIDGVIAVDSEFIRSLVELLGPIDMPDHMTVIDSSNFYDTLHKEIELNYDKSENKPKQILKDLLPLIIDKLMNESRYQDVLSLLLSSLQQKKIQIFTTDSSLQDTVKAFGWDGSVRSGTLDYLYVVSANIAGGKSDHAIYQTVDHHAEIAFDGTVIVTTKITKDHRADSSDLFAYVNNVDYMRFYVPRGSELLDAVGFKRPPDNLFRNPSDLQEYDQTLQAVETDVRTDAQTGIRISSEFGHSVFGGWLQVMPGEQMSAEIRYRLPFLVKPERVAPLSVLSFMRQASAYAPYSLLMQRQPGKKNVVFKSTVAFDGSLVPVWQDTTDMNALGLTTSLSTFVTELTQDSYYAILFARNDAQ